ncbi:MAG: glycine cleavage system protein T, partial [Euryarchaeota archaeon]|nr:glycine cleavage system protein T [Euryarchaeota archaeon]
MKYTALHDIHEKMGAKMTEFAGYHMPLWYTKIRDEHMAVRNSVGIFDVSHMGDLIVEGPDAAEFLSFALPTDVSKKNIMQASYSAFINHKGILIDDTIATRLEADKFLVVPNAATADIIYHWLYALSAGYDVEIKNVSENFSSIAVQGPKAEATLQKIIDTDLSKEKVPFFHAIVGNMEGVKIEPNELSGELLYISRTGYTGEDGFELIFPNSNAVEIWNKLLEAGKEFDLKPCGL